LLAKQQLQQQEKLLQPRSMLETTIPNLACSSSILLASPAAATPIDDVDNNDNNKKKNAQQQQQQQQHGDFAFFDEAFIYVRAGSGGQGSSTYKKAKKGANGIPDGGSGGSGGNVILRLDPGLNTLAGLGVGAHRPNALGGAAASSKRGSNAASSKEERLLSFRAKDGTSGGRMYDNGRKGEDCEVLVPPGTVVQRDVPSVTMAGDDGDGNGDDNPENGSDVSSSSNDWAEVGTISKKTPEIVVARGGKGGEGTATLKGKKKGATRRGPEGGEKGRIKLVLKIVADIALVGVPNAGKVRFVNVKRSAFLCLSRLCVCCARWQCFVVVREFQLNTDTVFLPILDSMSAARQSVYKPTVYLSRRGDTRQTPHCRLSLHDGRAQSRNVDSGRFRRPKRQTISEGGKNQRAGPLRRPGPHRGGERRRRSRSRVFAAHRTVSGYSAPGGRHERGSGGGLYYGQR
jgi:GTPase involved in cell partitioning and DNA repair